MSAAVAPSSGGFPASDTLRLLSIDGGGVKGPTTLLILKRLMRTVKIEGNLDVEPRPCQVFDLIGGNSTGGIIAIMLGRLGMSIEECIASYIRFGEAVFGQKPGSLLWALSANLFIRSPSSKMRREHLFLNANWTNKHHFRVWESWVVERSGLTVTTRFVCVTRKKTSKAELLRNYESEATDQENYNCKIWEAASATAAASLFFESVIFKPSGVEFVDGGLRRNNPISEVIREAKSLRDWKSKDIGCVVSLGTGWTDPSEVPARLDKFLRKCIDLTTDADEIADEFAKSPFGMELFSSSRYFRLSVQQGMSALQLDDWKETETMNALIANYLGKPEISLLVERCARSLLYPSLTKNTQNAPRPSSVPFGLCTNFVPRKIYFNALSTFFAQPANSTGSARICVLWGLGGVGKTQIALNFALSHAERFSILWVRADRLENFLVDYRKILDLLDPRKGATTPVNDQKATLDAIVQVLERQPLEWLLILDNADDLGIFRQISPDGICISNFIPNRGSVLITTRDSRFVGEVSDATAGIHVRSMDQSEAEGLLLSSLPPELRVNYGNATDSLSEDITELTEELGNLPLAIAQAAANIQYLRTGLHAYVELYKERKRRHELLEEPVRDKRRPPQSVLLTWQISFEHVEASDPTAARLLCYLGFLHWENIPGELLQVFPGLEYLDSVSFSKVVGKLLHLSLLERTSEDEFQMHPMVHYWISARLQTSERLEYVNTTLAIMASVFPMSQEPKEQASICRILLPHALSTVNQAEELDIISRPLARLMQVIAKSLAHIGVTSWALQLINRALDMGVKVWGENDISVLQVRKYRASILSRAARRVEAIAELKQCLTDVDSMNISEEEKNDESYWIKDSLASALAGIDDNAELEVEILRRDLLIEAANAKPEFVAGTLFAMIRKHNLCNTLIRLGKLEEARPLAEEVLDWALHGGKDVVTEEILLPWINSKAAILLRDNEKEKALQIYEDVLKRTLLILRPDDRNFWIAGSNVYLTLFSLQRYREGIDVSYSLFERVGETLLGGDVLETAISLLNVTGVGEQRVGRYKEAERCHRIVLIWSQQLHDQIKEQSSRSNKTSSALSDHDIHIYNLCLAFARQNHLQEMEDLRSKNQAEMQRAQVKLGSIEVRLQRDKQQEEIYHQAKLRLHNGPQEKLEQWWIDNKEAIEIVEHRLGFLDTPNLSEGTTPSQPEEQAIVESKRKSRISPFRNILDMRKRR